MPTRPRISLASLQCLSNQALSFFVLVPSKGVHVLRRPADVSVMPASCFGIVLNAQVSSIFLSKKFKVSWVFVACVFNDI